jgi:tetratricopeptide (TPR) repeat protein
MASANSSSSVSIRRSATTSVQERLDHLVQSHPQQAIVEAQRLVQASPHDPTTLLAGWAAIGRALFELGDMHSAPEAMRHALREGAATQSGEQLTSVRISAAAIYAESGKIGEGLAELARAEQDAGAAHLGRIQMQRAYILCNAGRLSEALHETALAEAHLRKSDRLGRLRLLVNRSLINLQRGELVAAEADLNKARKLADRLEQAVIAAGITANLGVVHARAGRIMLALQHFEEASALYEGAGNPLRMMAIMETDRAETLLHAGMFTEAVASAQLALAHARASGNIVNRSDAELLLARAQLAAGEVAAAERTAATAARTLLECRRRGVMLQARAVGLQASLTAVSDSDEALQKIARARRMAGRLDAFGWAHFGDELRCARLRCAARFGHMAEIEDDLALLRGSIRSRRPGVALRAWYAECLARAHAGDVSGAIRSARAGMQSLDRLRSSTTDLEMRAGLSAIGADLASVAMELAIAVEKPSGVLAWAERTRANAVRVETDSGPRQAVPRAATIVRELDGRTMVEFVINARHVWAVVVGKSARLVKIVPLDPVVRVSNQLATWMERIAQPAVAGSAAHPQELAAELDRLLIQPLGLRPGSEVVIVPVGPLHGVPWSSLPTLSGSRFSVSSSARAWLECQRRSVDFTGSSVGLLIGPDVLGTAVEQRAIRRAYPGAKVVKGARATAAGALGLLRELDVVQIAAHGTFRPDQPLMSSLRLDDGEMSMYEIAATTVRSRLVVLSSCEGGVHGERSGSEVLGLASVLLGRGAATVIAPTAIVSDHACADFVAELHDEWSLGIDIAEALSRVRRRWTESATLVQWATASAFTCFGSGSLTRARTG